MTTRREFLQQLSIAGAAGALGTAADAIAAEPPPETTRLRLAKVRSICLAPQYVAAELLRAEGFRDIEYLPREGGLVNAQAMARGEVDIGMNFAAPLVTALDMDLPIVLLGGIHSGCFELFVTDRVRSIKDLKGRSVAILRKNSGQHLFLASIATSVGLDPNRDIEWVDQPPAVAMKLLAEGKIDGYLGFPPDPQALRAAKVGRVLLNSASDRPWSQYFCCLVSASRDFARKHPIATKRAMRAILKASEICASSPEAAAKAFMDLGFETNASHAVQAIRELRYGKWRDYNPEETVRFYALRLREAGMVKSAPQKLITQGADWRFLNELKKELKA